MRATAGARFTYEDKSQLGHVYCDSTFCPASAAGIRVPFNGDRTWKNGSWKAGLEYDVAPESMLYATVSTGFKAGGFSPILPPNTFGPERLTAYAIGSKNRFFDNRLQVNAEAFYWDYKGQQVSFLSSGLVAPGVTGSVFVTENIGRSTIKGLDLDVEYLLTDRDRVTARVAYMDAKADDFVYRPASVPFSNCGITGAPPSVRVDCSGRPLPRAPTWSGSLSYEHTFLLADSGSLIANLSTRFASESWGSITYLPDHLQGNYTKSDASLTYYPPSDRWSLAVFVNNIENEAVQTMAGTYALMLVNYKNLQPPRTYGARFTIKFGGG